jgi:hypothetical protein
MNPQKQHSAKLVPLLLALALLVAAPFTRAADYVSVVTNTPGLLGYWSFDPMFLTNSVVNGYVGTLQGNAHLGMPGMGAPVGSDPCNEGLFLDGQASYLTTTLGGKITNAGTTMAWIYLTNYPSVAGRIFQITAEGDDGNDFDFQIDTDNLLHFYTDSGGSTVSPQPIPTSQWHFLAGTFVANTVRVIYIDGVPVATNTPGSHGLDTSFYTIGENLQFPGRYFEGTIAEVAVFDRALAASEIAAIYAAATPVLSISNAANSVVVSWPTNFPNYSLQTNGVLMLPGAWADFPVFHNIVGTNYQVTDSIAAASQFYRLKWPATAKALAIYSGNNQTGPSGTQLASPLVVVVTDSGGNPVQGITVNWAATAGGGSVGSASSLTGVNGQAQTTAKLGPSGGSNDFSATVAGLTGSPVSFQATGD